jgi:hypothetical protein
MHTKIMETDTSAMTTPAEAGTIPYPGRIRKSWPDCKMIWTEPEIVPCVMVLFQTEKTGKFDK